MRPEEGEAGGGFPRSVFGRSGTLGSVPSTFTTGAKYAGLGYATAVDAAIAPLMARHTHHELDDTPIIDKAFLVLMGNNHYVMDRVREGDRERLRAFVAWTLAATKAYGVKVVNAGGVETWGSRARGMSPRSTMLFPASRSRPGRSSPRWPEPWMS